MAIPQQYIEELTERSDVVEIISSYVQLKRRGRTYVGLCPFHNEKTGSFTVYPDSQSFYCFGCAAGGDIITFIKKIDNLDYVEAVKVLAARAGMPMPEEDDKVGRQRKQILEINKETARFFYQQMMDPKVGQKARIYWLGRGLTAASIKHFGLGYAPDGFHALRDYLRGKGYRDEELLEAHVITRSEKGNTYDVFRNRVMTPIFDLRGNVIAFGGRVMDDSKPKYINSPETLVYKKSRTFFALNYAKKSPERRYIICEGYMDVMSMHQAGFVTAVAGCGTALTADHVKLISQYADEVILCYDADEAGQKATARAIRLFEDSPVKLTVLSIPLEKAKDPDEFIKKYGAEAFRMLLEGSSNTVEYNLQKLRTKYDIAQAAGRVEYMRDAVAFLAANATPTEQDVYAGRVAQETDVAKSAVIAQLEAVSRSRSRRELRKREKALTQEGTASHIKTPYGAGAQALGVAYSEQQLLAVLIKNPEYFAPVAQALDAHTFVDGQIQALYTVVRERRMTGESVELTSLSQELDESAMALLSRVLAQNHDLVISEQDVQLYIRRLRDSVPTNEKVAKMDTQDLEQYLNNLRNEKE